MPPRRSQIARSTAVKPMAPAPRRNPNIDRPLPKRGLISPAHQRIIAIEITNACPNSCSNCTRFCPHQASPYFMSRGMFADAVDSLIGYEGLVSIMGGEPTIHPEFPALAGYAHQILQGGVDSAAGRQPIADLAEYREQHLASMHSPLGLFTALGRGYRRHYELIQRIFRSQWINTHEAGGLHQALLIARKDLGIPDDVWLAKRDRCWLQRLWSSCVTDCGAYFCEVAGALDRLFFGGERAWHVEPGWWKRTPAEFGQQLELCEYCSAPLAVPRRPDTDGRQDVSATTARMLREIRSPAAAAGQLVVHGPECLGPDYSLRIDSYLETSAGDAPRVTVRQAALRPQEVCGIVVCVDFGPILAKVIAHNIQQVDRLVVVTSPDDLVTQQVALDAGAHVSISDSCWDDDASFNKGKLLNDGLAAAKPTDWVLFHDADVLLPTGLRDWTKGNILNPGCLYWTSRYHSRSDDETAAIAADWTQIAEAHFRDDGCDRQPWGYFQLWHPRASCLAGRVPPVMECFPTAGAVDWNFMLAWPAAQRIRIDDATRSLSVCHVWHGDFASQWHGRGGDGRWRLAAQTGLDGNLWHVGGGAIPFPCHAKLQRIDTGEAMELELSNFWPIQKWLRAGYLFDVYVRGDDA